MNNSESATLMSDVDFRGRIKVCILKYATSIMNEDSSQFVNHAARYRWAQMAGQNPDAEAGRLQPMVVMDPSVQQAGSDIDDNALQGAVEAVVNKFI